MRAALFSQKSDSGDIKKFGTFEGVFLPTLLTILGAVMYLRTGWVVGEAGLLGAWLIIGLANLITICTGLSISTIATNIRVGAGGSFSIISQSLGLEVGGSVNLPFYLAQAISVAFYIFAFSEGWLSIFPTHSQALVVLVAYAVCFTVAFISVGLAWKQLLKENKKIFLDKTRIYIMPKERSIDIDDAIDFRLAEILKGKIS